MPIGFLGLGVLGLIAVVLFVLGILNFKIHPVMGILIGLGTFMIFLGIMVTAVFGDVGIIGAILSSTVVSYITVGSASYTVGTMAGMLF